MITWSATAVTPERFQKLEKQQHVSGCFLRGQIYRELKEITVINTRMQTEIKQNMFRIRKMK